ncbi:MAG: NADH-quinone oxidoreductase subunit M [Rickettsiales bacterium]|nr:NADH-quinone oxidoreductase subunit M [Rickettsiales bacterium]
MLASFPVLSLLLLVPFIGALFIFLFINSDQKNSDQNLFAMGIWISGITLLLNIYILLNYDYSSTAIQFIEKYDWITKYDISYKVGVDGLSIFFVLLTTILSPLCIIISKYSVTKRLKEYIILFLILESFVIGAFIALDLVVFYLFFELTLIPMFLIIGIWGGENRIYATFKFFLYTLAGSIFFLIAIIYIINVAQTADVTILKNTLPNLLSADQQQYLWMALFFAFAIKIPMWPVHTWLPDAHVQAPTAGSVMLAGVLIKLGAYAMIRFMLPLLPEASAHYQDFVIILGVIAIVYTSIVALMQDDMKKLIAYSSVAHMGYVVIGIFTFNSYGLNGAIFQMISHGLISAALFMHVGIVYDKLKTKKIKDVNGLAHVMPKFSILFIIFVLGSVALPGTSGFVGEFLVLVAIFEENILMAILTCIGVILGAVYMLWMVKQTIMGNIINHKIKDVIDINASQIVVLTILAFFTILLGVYPAIIIDVVNLSNDQIVNLYNIYQK